MIFGMGFFILDRLCDIKLRSLLRKKKGFHPMESVLFFKRSLHMGLQIQDSSELYPVIACIDNHRKTSYLISWLCTLMMSDDQESRDIQSSRTKCAQITLKVVPDPVTLAPSDRLDEGLLEWADGLGVQGGDSIDSGCFSGHISGHCWGHFFPNELGMELQYK